MPERVQLSRRKGYRKPAGAIVVARPSRWGNPFKVGRLVPEGDPQESTHFATREDCVEEFDEMLSGFMLPEIRAAYPSDAEIREHLAGHDLACWCPLDQPCHADVLLEIANA